MSIQHWYAASTVGAYTLTGGRAVASAAALIALAGVVAGGLALARGDRKRRSTIALAAGTTGLIAGGLVVATADGGPGSGSGIVGGFAALLFGLIATVLGGLALARSRRGSHPLP
jgi:hypothetical protein